MCLFVTLVSQLGSDYLKACQLVTTSLYNVCTYTDGVMVSLLNSVNVELTLVTSASECFYGGQSISPTQLIKENNLGWAMLNYEGLLE